MRQKCDQERISEDLTIEIPYSGNTVQVEPKNKSDTSKNRGDWNHFKIIHKIPEQRTGKQEIKELRQTAIFGAAHKLGKVLM